MNIHEGKGYVTVSGSVIFQTDKLLFFSSADDLEFVVICTELLINRQQSANFIGKCNTQKMPMGAIIK